jgi:hypothetical protein
MKIRLFGDICHPGIVEVEVDSLKDLESFLVKRDGILIDDQFKSLG